MTRTRLVLIVLVAIGSGVLVGALIADQVSAARKPRVERVAVEFTLTAHHPTGTVLGENEVIYQATPANPADWACMEPPTVTCWFQVRHTCEGAAFPVDQTKALWHPEAPDGPRVGDAYFLAFGDSCSGVVVDYMAGNAVVSNRVTYGTNPLPTEPTR